MERESTKNHIVAKPKIHIAPPSSASEIRKDLGVSPEDMRIVSEVLHELFPKQFPTTK